MGLAKEMLLKSNIDAKMMPTFFMILSIKDCITKQR